MPLMDTEMKTHASKPGGFQAPEFPVRHLMRHQCHAQIAAAASRNRVFNHRIVETMHQRLDDHAATDTEMPVQGKQGFFRCIGRVDAAVWRKRKTCHGAEYVHVRIAGASRQQQPWP